jgi:hypothetical protein
MKRKHDEPVIFDFGKELHSLKVAVPRATKEDISLLCDVGDAIKSGDSPINLDTGSFGNHQIDDKTFDLRLNDFVTHISDTDVLRWQNVSSRVIALHYEPSQNCIAVVMSFADATVSVEPYIEPANRTQRQAPIDWDVEDEEDIKQLDRIADDVANVVRMMPVLDIWVEDLVPDMQLQGKDGTERVPEVNRLGYALCFSNLPDMNLDFLLWLKKRHQHILRVFITAESSSAPMLVVVVRRTRASRETAAQAAASFLPQGTARTKRRRR